MKQLFILLSLLFLSITFTQAQQTTTDDYSDYSYLWDKSSKKKKDKKKPTESTVSSPAISIVAADTTKNQTKKAPSDSTLQRSVVSQMTDSLQVEPEPIFEILDTLQKEQIVVSDTIKKKSTEVPLDTLKKEKPIVRDSIRTEPEPQKTEITEEIVKPEKVKRQKAEPPVFGDFRSGPATGSDGSVFNGGFTFTQIGDQYYAGLVLNPELNFGKVGVGLNVPILYGLKDQKVRTEIFEDGVGAARLITYLRMGIQKTTPIYFKVGQLNNTMIGFGGLVNNYTNSTSFEKRTIGLHYDINFKGFVGLEGMYSDFTPSSFNLLAIRPYVRPLIYSGLPIVNTLEVGTTILQDKDQTDLTPGDETTDTYLFTKDGIGAFGLDAGMTLLRIPFIQIDLFANYSRLSVSSKALTDSLALSTDKAMADGFKNGHGASVGFNFRFNFIADLFSTDLRIERLANSEHYQSQFFDATYQINKDAKIYGLGASQKMSGIYGSLTGQVFKKVLIGGSLMLPDNISEETPAVVRINADLDRLANKFSLHGSYIKGNLTTLDDAFTFDERSLAKIRFIYHLNRFLATGVDYYWAFVPDGKGGYRADKYISPYFGLSISF